MTGRTFADLVVLFQPEIQELIRRRDEVRQRRFRANPPTPTVQQLIADSPITIRQDDDGRYSASIDCGTAHTGVGDCDTDIECFRAAIRHLAKLAGEQWADEDDDA